MINKRIIEWKRDRYNKNNRIIFIIAWNEQEEGTYLEPSRKYGFASFNLLSKNLFNKPIKELNTNFTYFNGLFIYIIQI